MLMKCEINGCQNKAAKTPHHILSRSAHRKAAEVEANKIYLCLHHHYEVHYIGMDTFAAKYMLKDRFEKAREAVWKLEAGLKESEG